MARSEADLRLILDRYRCALERTVRVERIVLYGSHARGDARDDSDIDVLVVSPDFDPRQPLRDQRTVSLAKIGVDLAISPIPVPSSQWRHHTTPSLLDVVRREGKVIYEQAA
jgi:predicted nucleotidyltransferase